MCRIINLFHQDCPDTLLIIITFLASTFPPGPGKAVIVGLTAPPASITPDLNKNLNSFGHGFSAVVHHTDLPEGFITIAYKNVVGIVLIP